MTSPAEYLKPMRERGNQLMLILFIVMVVCAFVFLSGGLFSIIEIKNDFNILVGCAGISGFFILASNALMILLELQRQEAEE